MFRIYFVYVSYILRVSFVECKERVWLSYEEGCCWLGNGYLFQRGVMPTKNWKLMPGIGRPRTERYSSLKRLLIVPLSDHSAHEQEICFSSVMLLI